jgi:hypothetical protein
MAAAALVSRGRKPIRKDIYFGFFYCRPVCCCSAPEAEAEVAAAAAAAAGSVKQRGESV